MLGDNRGDNCESKSGQLKFVNCDRLRPPDTPQTYPLVRVVVPAVDRGRSLVRRCRCTPRRVCAQPLDATGNALTVSQGALSALLPKHGEAQETCTWAWHVPLQARGEPCPG